MSMFKVGQNFQVRLDELEIRGKIQHCRYAKRSQWWACPRCSHKSYYQFYYGHLDRTVITKTNLLYGLICEECLREVGVMW